ncbi:MAG: OadG family protein [Campylobacteraceae bacterium]|nr:OadG family protein [Campylobacteraceae bacterium]
MSIVFIVAASILIVLFSAVLVYQVRLVRKISFLKAYDKEAKEIEEAKQQKIQNPVLAAVITAAINQYKNQNSQR